MRTGNKQLLPLRCLIITALHVTHLHSDLTCILCVALCHKTEIDMIKCAAIASSHKQTCMRMHAHGAGAQRCVHSQNECAETCPFHAHMEIQGSEKRLRGGVRWATDKKQIPHEGALSKNPSCLFASDGPFP